MKILVTGANGFVGAHLCDHLLAEGHTVVAAVREESKAPAGTTPAAVGEIGPGTDWSGALKDVEAVIHLAARVHVMNDTSADPLAEFRRVNVGGTRALFEAATAAGVRRFVFLSSIKVNGEETGTPFTAVSPALPQDPYGVSKHEAEVLLTEGADGGPEVVIVRTPLVYGPRVKGNFIRMLRLASSSIPIPLATVKNHRTKVSVWNLADLLTRAATEPAAAGTTIVTGDPTSPSTPELFQSLYAAMGRRSRLVPFPQGVLALAARLAGQRSSLDRLTQSLEVVPGSATTSWAWVPPLDFDEGIRRTVAWYSSQDKGNS